MLFIKIEISGYRGKNTDPRVFKSLGFIAQEVYEFDQAVRDIFKYHFY